MFRKSNKCNMCRECLGLFFFCFLLSDQSIDFDHVSLPHEKSYNDSE